MAVRRMISAKVVDTDSFLEMPVSTRCLYYDFCIRADDDGFVGSPRKIMRMVGCSDDDIRILIQKKYIIPFQSGICVISDWFINNYIRPDRRNPTIYTDELKKLQICENGRYHEISGEKGSVIPSDIPMVYPIQYSIEQIKLEQTDRRVHARITNNESCKDKFFEESVFAVLKKFGMTKKQTDELIAKYGIDAIYTQIAEAEKQGEKIHNKGGWLVAALRGGVVGQAQVERQKTIDTGRVKVIPLAQESEKYSESVSKEIPVNSPFLKMLKDAKKSCKKA